MQVKDVAALALVITASTAGFRKDMQGAEGAVKGFTDKSAQRMKQFQQGAKTAMSMASKAVAGFLTVGFAELHQSMEATGQLENLLKNLGISAAKVTPRVQAMGDAMVQLGFDDEDATNAFRKLLGATKDVNASMGLMPLIADAARYGHMGLAEAQNAVLRALQGNARALKPFGVTMDMSIKDPAVRAQKALQDLADLTKGSATAALKDPAIAAEVLRQQFNNLAGEAASGLLPAIQSLIPYLQGFFNWAKKNGNIIKNVLIGAVAALTVAWLANAVAAIAATWPFWLLIAALAAYVSAIAYGWNNSKQFRDALFALSKTVGDILLRNILTLTNGLILLSDTFKKVFSIYSSFARLIGREDFAKNLDEWGSTLDGLKANAEDFKKYMEDARKTLNSAEFEKATKKLRFQAISFEELKNKAKDALPSLQDLLNGIDLTGQDTKVLTDKTKKQTQAAKDAARAAREQAAAFRTVADAMNLITDSYMRNQSYLAATQRVSGAGSAGTFVEVPVIIDGQVLFRVTQKASLLNNRRNATNGLAKSGSVI